MFENYQNKDEVLFRNVLIGLRKQLNNMINWNNTVDNINTKVDVPFYFTVAGSERFLNDVFLNTDKLNTEGKISGLYEKLPRGIMNINSISLQEEYLTNKYKRANYLKQTPEGDLKQYSAEFISAHFKINLDCTILLDSIIDIFKCINKIFDNLYKNINFNVDVFGVNVHCYFAIPPDIEKEKIVNFGVSDKKEIKVQFPIDLQVSYPIFKQETEMFVGDVMMEIKPNVKIENNKETNKYNSVGRILNNKTENNIWADGNEPTNFYPD